MTTHRKELNFWRKYRGVMGGVLFLFLINVFSSVSHAQALDVNSHPHQVPTKSKDENKAPYSVKDQNKSNPDNIGTDEGPLARATVSALKKNSSVFKTANPDADTNTKAILSYIGGLPLRTSDRVVSGQFIGHAARPNTSYFEENYEKLVTDLEDSSGESIGMVGADYAQLTDESPELDLGLTNEPLIDHWNQGGLVTVTNHSRNPWTGEDARDTTVSGNFVEILTTGTVAHTAWMKELDQIAAGLQELQEAGVTVLWRPLHESNGNAFWWSKASSSEFKALWKQMFDYFTEDKNLNNLLWVYSAVPKIKSNDGKRSETLNYPGSDYVDITGLDVYMPHLKTVVPAYKRMLKLNKPFGLTEYGPYKGSDADKDPSLEEPHFSYKHLIDEIRTNVPTAAFFQAWNHGHAMASQLDAEELLQDSWITDAKDCL